MSEKKPTCGFIGLGLMGGPMTDRLLEAGIEVTVWNRSRDKMVPFLKKGAKEGASPEHVARQSEIVFTCVTDAAAMEEVVFGKDGVIEAAGPDKILVDFSTIPPATCVALATRLKERTGMRWIDAPVTGGRVGAINGKLVIMAGGAAEDVEAVRPVIMHMAQRFSHMGPQGHGLVTKLCGQLVNACTKVVLSEMLTLARRGGIDGGRLPEVLKGGSSDSSQMQREVPRMAQRDFEHPHGTAYTILKDLNIIRDFAQAAGAALPITALVNEFYRLHIARGYGGHDSISIAMLYDDGKK